MIALARDVLKARKATEYAPLLIAGCSPAQLPPTLAKLMLDINAYLMASKPAGTATAPGAAVPGSRRPGQRRRPGPRRSPDGVMDLDETRRAILDTVGHLLIEGGPGSGKTTIALLKAARTVETLEPEQRVLFLSFSRAAVRQISDRLAEHLARAPAVAWRSAPSTPSSSISSARTGRC